MTFVLISKKSFSLFSSGSKFSMGFIMAGAGTSESSYNITGELLLRLLPMKRMMIKITMMSRIAKAIMTIGTVTVTIPIVEPASVRATTY